MAIEVDFKQVEARLMELERKAKSETIHQSLKAGAKIVEREIKNEIRKHNHIDHGILYNSIKETKLSMRGTKSWMRVGIDPNATNPYNPDGSKRKEPRKVTIYGFILEHGTKYTAGTHWMSTARDRSYEESRNAIAKELKRRLNL